MKYIIILHKDNREYIVDEYPNLQIVTDEHTQDNIIHIHEGVIFLQPSEFILRSIRGNFHFLPNTVFEKAQLRTGPGCFEQNMQIGKKCYFELGLELVFNNDFCSCFIGDNCHFERNIEIWTGDGHAIINKHDMHAMNCQNYTINIASNVFVGHNSVLLKKTRIGENTIVKSNSIITKDFSNYKNVVLEGAPARVTESNVIWEMR